MHQRFTLTVLAVALLTGCAATTPSAPAASTATPASSAAASVPTPAPAPAATETAAQTAVRTRAQARWDLLVAGKFEEAYTYLTPAYRALRTPTDYRNRFSNGAKWMGAKSASVECASPERCTAHIQLETLVVARGFNRPIKTTLTETWLLEDGQWWYHQSL